MPKYLFVLIPIFLVSCKVNHSLIKEHVDIDVYTYERDGEMKASTMPDIKQDSELMSYKRRFEYLLINRSEIHLPENSEKRNKIWSQYPDTMKLKRLYLKEYVHDKKLTEYFEQTYAPIADTNLKEKEKYSEDELMEVASKFFYCDRVFPDTSIQTHVCVGLNGVSEANWDKDYTLLAAFCYEAIFNDLMKDSSQIDESYSKERVNACKKFISTITTLDQYLLDVRHELFTRMKDDPKLRELLMDYYVRNRNNLAFKIED